MRERSGIEGVGKVRASTGQLHRVQLGAGSKVMPTFEVIDLDHRATLCTEHRVAAAGCRTSYHEKWLLRWLSRPALALRCVGSSGAGCRTE